MRQHRVPAVIFGGLAVFAAVAMVWFAVETVLLWTGQQPITWYVRNYTSWQPGVFALVLALVGFAVGSGVTHFWWDAVSPHVHRTLGRLRGSFEPRPPWAA